MRRPRLFPTLCRIGFQVLSLLDGPFTSFLLDWPLQRLCGMSVPGHSYQVEMIVGEEGTTYVLDPHTRCADCGAPLTAQGYEMVIEQMNDLAESTEESW